jgi:hypothetical protein
MEPPPPYSKSIPLTREINPSESGVEGYQRGRKLLPTGGAYEASREAEAGAQASVMRECE